MHLKKVRESKCRPGAAAEQNDLKTVQRWTRAELQHRSYRNEYTTVKPCTCTGYERSGLTGIKDKKTKKKPQSTISIAKKRRAEKWHRMEKIHGKHWFGPQIKVQPWRLNFGNKQLSEALLVIFCVHVRRVPPQPELQGSLEGRWSQLRPPARL